MESEEDRQEYSPQLYTPEQRSDITKWRLEAQEIIDRIEHHLRGEFRVKEEKKIGDNIVIIEKYKEFENAKKMNPLGAKTIVTWIETMVNKVSFLSSITEEDIIELCKATHLSIAREVYNNWDRFEVRPNPGPFLTQVMNMVYLALKRAQGAGEREALKTTETVLRRVDDKVSAGLPFIGRRNNVQGN